MNATLKNNVSFGAINMRTPLLLGLATWFALAGGCAPAPELIDRTQPNYLKKADLLSGTWYVRRTTTSVPPTAYVAVVGQSTSIEKVRFEIQEGALIAFRTYEAVPGTDQDIDRVKSSIGNVVTVDGKPYRGAAIGSWAITSHFDRQRQYSAATGEQMNVLEENSYDRPWYEREYMRVDWGRNSIKTDDTWSENGWWPDMEAAEYIQENDPNAGDDAPLFDYVEKADGSRELAYFDYTTRAVATPDTIDFPGYGVIPFCWVAPMADCAGATVKFRTSFRRVDEAAVLDYEPLPYGDKLQKKFGFFRTERFFYDRNRSYTDLGRIYFANRHNIWQRAHDDNGNVIPIANRAVKPIVYYLSTTFPKELLPSAREIEKSWDMAFRRAVAVPAGKDRTKVDQVFFLCENPVPEGAPTACGPAGFSPRLGDIRYNMLYWVEDPQLSGPLGLAQLGSDPETGQLVSAPAFIYGASMDIWTGQAQQIVDALNGETTLDELIAGKDVKDFVATHLNATDPRRPLTGPWQAGQPLAGDPTKPLGAYFNLAGVFKEKVQVLIDKGLPLQRQNRRQVVDAKIANEPMLESLLVDDPEVRGMVRAMAPGDSFRRKLDSDPAFYRNVARQMLLQTDRLTQLAEERVNRLTRQCLWMGEFADGPFYGLAVEMAKVYKDSLTKYMAQGMSAVDAKAAAKKDVWNQLRIAGFRSVAEHELGHDMGLRHNFQGSADALNFMDGYWDLRKQTIGVTMPGSNERVFPADPASLKAAAQMNEAQTVGRLREYQYSSIMDYGSRMNSDIHGVGKYDAAAILFAYSGASQPGYVEVFNEHRYDPDYTNPNITVRTTDVNNRLTVRGAHTEIPIYQVMHYTPINDTYTDRFHYTTLPFQFADVKNGSQDATFEQMLDQGIARMNSRSYVPWSEVVGYYEAIDQKLKEWVLNKDDPPFGSTSVFDKSRVILNEKLHARAPMEVPYMFCTDDEVGARTNCNRWDMGADTFEITTNWLEQYDNYYPFTNFRRDRLSCDPGLMGQVSQGSCFSPLGVLTRHMSRGIGNLPNIYQHWLFDIYYFLRYLQAYGKITPQLLEQEFDYPDPLIQNYMTMAVMDSTNAMLAQLATPAAGYFGKTATGAWVHLADNNQQNTRLSPTLEDQLRARVTTAAPAGPGYVDMVYIPRGPGRNMHTLFETDGYAFASQMNEMGHYWDQRLAMSILSSSETGFLGVDRGADALQYSLPYYLVFNKELSRSFSGIWLEDNSRLSAQIVKTGDGLAMVLPATPIRGESYVQDFRYPLEVTEVKVNGVSVKPEKVNPSPTFGTRFIAQLYGMAYFTENLNQDFASQNQVFRLGSGEALKPADLYKVESFTDPFGGGFSYAALVETASATEPPAAGAMILRAKALKAKWDLAKVNGQVDGLSAAQWEAQTRDAVRSLEIMRALYGIFTQW